MDLTNYSVKYRSYIICNNVDKNCARAICQLLYFLINELSFRISLEDIKVSWTEPSLTTETTLLTFIQD